MITTHFYKRLLVRCGKLPDDLHVGRLVEYECLKVLKEIEKHLELKGDIGTATYHVQSIINILKNEGYRIER